MSLYNPPAFREDDLDRQRTFITRVSFGLLVSAVDDVPQATSIPFHLAGGGRLGVLQGHLARANDHWRKLDGKHVLVIFQGPDAYVSPSWYASKAEHGKVVPTWNYVTVHARGVARVIDDADWLHRQITRLTEDHEQHHDEPWRVTDAPASFIDGQVRGIVGVEIEIQSLEGKWKTSQNRSAEDRRSAADGLAASGAEAMATLVRGEDPE